MKLTEFRFISVIRFSKSIGLLLLSFSLFQNCFFNPVVNGLLSPLEEENNSAYLSILGLAPSSFGITGQLKSNGMAVSGASVRIIGSTNETASSTTDSAGRFKLISSTGSITLEINHSETIFTLELTVTPPIVTLVSIGNSSYTVSNLESYPSSAEIPSYLELTSSMPYEGLIIENSNYMATISSGFLFNFSEELELPSNNDLWREQNILISPSLGYYSTGVGGSSVNIQIDSGTYVSQTDYVLTLMPGIRSSSGKSVKPSTIRFRIGALAL